MARQIDLATHTDNRGNLTVIEKVIPFDIKRIFYIYGVDDSERGGHRHHTTVQAAVCIQGACKIHCDNNREQNEYVLDKPYKCLILEPEDWHTMYDFTPDCVLVAVCDREFEFGNETYNDYDEFLKTVK